VPELPEVEAVRRVLQKAVRGRRIVRARVVPDPLVYQDVLPHEFARSVTGRRIERVERKGKHFWFVLDRRPWPLFHFGMTGWFHVERRGGPREQYRFERLALEMDDGTRAVFTDPRRFGRIRLQQDPIREPPIARLGFDPLFGLPRAAELSRILGRRNAPIKAVLLDQSLFAGVGNWVADEVLFQARLRPDRRASSLAPAEVGALRQKILSVVRRAVAVDADSERFPASWLFHHRWGRDKEARTSRGETIVHSTIGGRTTAWVPARQK
jgi:formamidopyrimidine-DNA glycosylase